MTPPVLEAAADGLGSLREGAVRDPRGLWRFLTIVGVVAVLSALAYLLSTRTVVEDRYTGAMAAKDLKAQAEINAELRQSMAVINAQLGFITQQLQAIRADLKK